ncbi:pimeloyl-CoA dehydrogenase large subunit [Salmonella enterica subsp. enterica]|nr:pimeloyl-CoA dehydrogenase large subunit [Salmonella enterica subsp. enterica serovar Enteritidis]MIL09117.1 pimeloyl-CoA dehydrogenase large subunit [Salmonella enterica subsp. enterica serovar Enteritidis]
MDLSWTAGEMAFRNGLRAFFSHEVPQRIRDKVSAGASLTRDDIVTSHRVLNAHGLAVPHWPLEWGGRDWSAIERYIWIEELQRAAVPLPLQFNCNMIGPVLVRFGSAEQQARFLVRAANLDDWWCQGFSEPDAGSDLASLRTKAVHSGNSYIVSGQKTWTTYAQHADWMFCLVRTDAAARKQSGISFLLIDMKSPGVSVRPIVTIDGRHEVNEVYLDNVEVPLKNLVGEENRGWDCAKFLLASERAGIARIGLSKERVERVRRLAQQIVAGRGTIWDSEVFRARVLMLEADLKALEITQMQALARQQRSTLPAVPDPTASILKLKGSQLQQAAAELLMEIAGDRGVEAESAEGRYEWAATAMANYVNHRKVSIYGGSNEIQRDIIAKSILGL